MNDNILVLDCDGVIFDSLPLIDNYVKNIKYIASDSYKRELDQEEFRARLMLNKWEEERSNDPNQYGLIKKRIKDVERKRKEHYEYKDKVLEEVTDKYKGKIDYQKIYQLENTYDGVINMIYTIYGKGLFNEIYVLSHVNCKREINAKKKFFETYLPMVKFVPVMFHIEPFYNQDGSKNTKRKRTNKIEYFKNYLSLEELSCVYFIDDTESIIKEALDLGVNNTFYKNDSSSTIDLLTKVAFDSIGVISKENISR